MASSRKKNRKWDRYGSSDYSYIYLLLTVRIKPIGDEMNTFEKRDGFGGKDYYLPYQLICEPWQKQKQQPRLTRFQHEQRKKRAKRVAFARSDRSTDRPTGQSYLFFLSVFVRS